MLLNTGEKLLDKESKYWYYVIEPLGARYFSEPSFKKPKMPRQGAKVGDVVRVVKKRKSDGWLQLDNSLWIPLHEKPDESDEKSRGGLLLQPFLHNCPVTKETALTSSPSLATSMEIMKKAESPQCDAADGSSELAEYSEINNGNNQTNLSVFIDAKDILGRSPLHSAATSGNAEIGRVLLEHKADINARDNDGITPLYLAANEDKSRFVKMLINRNADLRIPREDGWTALHVAAAFSRASIVKMLLEAGANPISRDKYGSIPLEVVESGSDDSDAVAQALKAAMKNIVR
mmetsp:Transcript_19800/g.31469  ORF Transcript_19800/g.31469 Transcript_19800/m.31469 type:complete len:290 (-) Transcript_19800:290-1159(-)